MDLGLSESVARRCRAMDVTQEFLEGESDQDRFIDVRPGHLDDGCPGADELSCAAPSCFSPAPRRSARHPAAAFAASMLRITAHSSICPVCLRRQDHRHYLGIGLVQQASEAVVGHKDSNLEPDRYERSAPSFPASIASISFRSRCFCPHPVPAIGEPGRIPKRAGSSIRPPLVCFSARARRRKTIAG